MDNIPNYDKYRKVELINKGWSNDKKYCVETFEGEKMLLRVADITLYDRKKTEFEMMRKVATLDVQMCKPLEFGIFQDVVFSIHSWIDGKDLADEILNLSEDEQYQLGIESGKMLKKIHTLQIPSTNEKEINILDWATKFNNKIDIKIKKYRECGLRFKGDEAVINYIEQNRSLLNNRPQCFQHGDFHIGNMMLENGALRIIDFDRYDFGDPWEEFNRVVWCAQKSPHFATGQLNGYFDGKPTLEFFQLLALYICGNMLSSIYWAISFGQKDIDTMMKQSQDIMHWYNQMDEVIPSWYLEDINI